MTQIKLILAIALISALSFSNATVIDNEKDYANIDGTQIYLFQTSKVFGYLSIDNTVTTFMKATMIFYSTSTVSSLSNSGIWSGIGFGTSNMKGSNMIICGMDIGSSMWCNQYTGNSKNVSSLSTQSITVTDSQITDLTVSSEDYGNYASKVTWSFTVDFDSTDLNNILTGSETAISAWGYVPSSKSPEEHVGDYRISTGDGNKVTKLTSTSTTDTTTTATTTTSADSTTTSTTTTGTDTTTTSTTTTTSSATAGTDTTTTSADLTNADTTTSTGTTTTDSTTTSTTTTASTNTSTSGNQSAFICIKTYLNFILLLAFILL